MREYLKGIFQEKDLPGMFFGVIAGEGAALLIDAPLRAEDARGWLAAVEAQATPAFLVVLDENVDRALGARHVDLPRIAHVSTSAAIYNWPDTYKGGANPIGSEVDDLKRVTGIKAATPDVVFWDEMTVELPGRPVRLTHRPGPTPGSIWVEVPDKQTVYVGDAVTAAEPPYVGNADLEAWMDSLDRLRNPPYDEFKVLSSRDGLVDRDQINEMARFLRKLPVRVDRLSERVDVESAAETIALELLDDFKVTRARTDMACTRLKAGLLRLYARQHPSKS